MRRYIVLFALFLAVPLLPAAVTGQLKRWHKVTVTITGPQASETGNPNPFRDYRMTVTFTHPGSGTTYVVPGYFAADGDAANTGAASGDSWRAHLAPGRTGTWNWEVDFRSGGDCAVNGGGSELAPYDGTSGSFEVAETDKTGRDLRAKGRLDYVGGHYLQFQGNGEYFLKQGADAPENFLAYADFDGPFKSDGHKDNLIKDWQPHVQDWRTGDPTWAGGKGKGIIGAINYLASEGLNAFSFIPMNIGGDDKNVFPYLDYDERYRLDVSRLAQWEIVFAHGTNMGMFLHFKTQETENELLLDGGDLGVQRKLYYRELIARFGHHLALNWNLGEEINNASTAQKQAWAQYFHDTDPYHHHIVIHNGSNHYDLLGSASKLTGFSKQTGSSDFSGVHSGVKNYIDRSRDAGKPWAVACDEPGDASHALRPDDDAGSSHEDGRKNGIWGSFLAGGWGNEWYFGYQHAHSDLTCNDFRSRDAFWDYCRHALHFFEIADVPYWQMVTDNGKSSASADYCFYKAGSAYIVYLKNGGTTDLDLSGASGTYSVRWYDPRGGGSLQSGSVTSVTGGGSRSLGSAPSDTGADWVILVRKTGGGGNLAPNADAGADVSVDDGDGDGSESVTLDGSNSSDADGSVVSWAWSEGGTQLGTGQTLTHVFALGGHTVTLTVTDDDGATDTDTVQVTVDEPGAGPTVTSLTLVDAAADADIGALADGDTIDLAQVGTELSVRANVNAETSSVRFGLDGNANYQTENVAPYALAGDSSGDYNAWTPTVGDHTLSATPFDADNAGGTAGDTVTVTFTVVDGQPNQPPTADAGEDQAVTDDDGDGSEAVVLDGSGSSDPDGSIASWVWEEGATQVATGATPSVILAVGTHTLTLTVTDDDGDSASDTVTVTVEEQAPALRTPELPDASTGVAAGLDYAEYHTGALSSLPDFDGLTPVATGVADQPGVDVRTRDSDFALVFTGYLAVPADGTWTLYTESDDGSKLYVGETLVVDNDGTHAPRERSGQIGLAAGLHAVRIEFFERGGGEELTVRWQGQDTAKAAVPVGSWYRDDAGTVNQPPVADAGPDLTVIDDDGDGGEAVVLDGSGSSDPDGSIASWVWEDGATQVATGATPSVTLAVGTHTLTLTVTDDDGDSASDTVTVQVIAGGLPAPWTAEDVGAVAATGDTTYADGTFAVTGSGNDIWNRADEFRFVHQVVNGDVTITARVRSIDDTHSWAKAGVMVRQDTTADTVHAMCVQTAGNGMAFQRRTSVGASSSHTKASSGSAPGWVRMERSGDVLTGYVSEDGVAWTQAGSVTISMDDPVAVGLCVTAHNDGALCEAVFTDVTVETGGASNQAPVVDAGANQSLTLPDALALLDGTVSDPDGDPLDVQWSVDSGPGAVTFGDATAVDTDAGFAVAGVYVLRLTAADGIDSASDTVSVTVETAPTVGEVVLAADAGGDGCTALDGTIYLPDTDPAFGVSGGRTYSTGAAIGLTEDDVLYQTERYGNLSYAAPVPDGDYELVLHLAEIYWKDSGKRIFDVEVEGVKIIDDLDLYVASGGRYLAYDVTVPVTVTDGVLDLDFITEKDNAKLAGFRLVRSAAANN